MSLVSANAFDNRSICRGLTFLKIAELDCYGEIGEDYIDWLKSVIKYNFYYARRRYLMDENSLLKITKATFSGSLLKKEYRNATLDDAIKFALLWEK